jgi:hypothetical protein
MRRFVEATTDFLAWLLLAATIAVVFMCVATPVKADTCSTNTPLSVTTEHSPNGIIGNPPGPNSGSIVSQLWNGGGWDGVANLSGTANCPGYGAALNAVNKRIDQQAAVAAALSQPAWLNEKENFSFTGGVGFTDDALAFGGTALVRVPETPLSLYGGAAVSSEGNEWSGKAGGRLAF